MKNCLLLILIFLSKIVLAQTVLFRTTVEYLRLRESPNLESAVIKTINKGSELTWLNIRSEQKVSVDWKNEKATDYWYKVQYDHFQKDSVAWVFGKGIEFLGMDFGKYENPIPLRALENKWLKINQSSETEFKNQPLISVNWIENKVVDYDKEHMIFVLSPITRVLQKCEMIPIGKLH
jgi:hypothetical protein